MGPRLPCTDVLIVKEYVHSFGPKEWLHKVYYLRENLGKLFRNVLHFDKFLLPKRTKGQKASCFKLGTGSHFVGKLTIKNLADPARESNAADQVFPLNWRTIQNVCTQVNQ